MDYGGFISETFVNVGIQRVRATDIAEVGGGGNCPPFRVHVTKTDGKTLTHDHGSAAVGKADFTRMREEWLDAIGVDDNGVGLTTESRAWQAQQPS